MEIRPGAFAGERWTPDPLGRLLRPARQGRLPLGDDDDHGPGRGRRCARDRRPHARHARGRHRRRQPVRRPHCRRRARSIGSAAPSPLPPPPSARPASPRSPRSSAPAAPGWWRPSACVADLIDTGLPAGPSEAIVLADATANPDIAALDLLIEAEHGPDSSAFLVTDSREVATRARARLPELIANLGPQRRGFVETVLCGPRGGIVLAPSLGRGAALRQRLRPRASRGPLRRAASAPGRHPPCRRDPARPEHADHHRQFLPRPRLRPAHRRLGAHLVGARRPRLHEAHQPRPRHRQGLPGAGPPRARCWPVRGLRGARAGAVGGEGARLGG